MSDPQWDQVVEDTGWELRFIEFQLTDGMLNIGVAANELDALIADGWEVQLVGRDPADGHMQMCLRRPFPNRAELVEQVLRVRQFIQGRHN